METRDKIKETAAELFSQHGYDGVSVRDIVEKAKVNLGAITYHFGGKENLYRELIVDMAGGLKDNITQISQKDETATEKFKEFIRLYLTYIFTNPVRARMVFREMSMGDKRFMNIIYPYINANAQMLIKIMQEGIANGEFRKMDPQLAVFSMIGNCLQFIQLKPIVTRLFPDRKFNEQFLEHFIEHTTAYILGGLKAEKRR